MMALSVQESASETAVVEVDFWGRVSVLFFEIIHRVFMHVFFFFDPKNPRKVFAPPRGWDEHRCISLLIPICLCSEAEEVYRVLLHECRG